MVSDQIMPFCMLQLTLSKGLNWDIICVINSLFN